MSKFLAASLAVFGIALLGVFAGCGSGGGNSSSAAPTKAAYLEEVNKICSEGQDQHDQLIHAALKKLEAEGENPKVREKLVLELQQPYVETTERLADLTPPEGAGQKVEALISAREKAAEKVEEEPLVVFEGHPYRQVEKLAKSAGAGECII